MKDIKFRVFRKHPNQQMIYFSLNDLIFNTFNKQVLLDFEGVRDSLMQCTGLKDRNGKEIYEGDIFGELGGDKERPHEIEYHAHVYFDDDLSAFCVETCQGGWKYLTDYMDENYCIIVGNIHENPEILEAVK